MSEQTIAEKSLEIRQETQEFANTRGRVANVLDDINATKANKSDVAQSLIDQNQNLQNHINDHSNPHQVTKSQIGLGNVDNTSDLDKPISTAVQQTINAIVNNFNGGLAGKVDKTTTTITAPDATFKYAYIFDDNNNVRRMLAGDLGKNVANSALTSVPGAGLTLGANWTLNTAGFYYSITGLSDKSSDNTFSRMMVQNAAGQISYSNGKNIILNFPSLLNDSEKTSWRNGMRLSTEIYSIGQPRIDSVILPFIDNSYTFTQYITLIGLNLFVDNQTPNAQLVMKRVKDVNGSVLPTPEVYNITNFNVLQTNPNMLNFGLNWSTYPQGYYQFFCTHNLLTNLSSPELLVKQGISFTSLNPVWQDLTGAASVDGNNNIVLGGAGSARTNILIDTSQMVNGFVVKCSVNTSVTNNGANFPGGTRFTMKGDDGLEYGVTLTYNIDFYPNSVGGFTTNVDVIYISYYNGFITLTAEVNGKTKVFAVTSIPTTPRYFYAYRAGGGVGSFSARPTQLLLL
ncbi:hypothetical protein [Chryseobacterium daeguense]|uniref:hypothetical protein n=1 Tax=Chryseobacterium daeguense TaxID=412438 RepID=UPI00041AA766|nr:hypothetical protein [Chryseobacterium daeguense]